MAAVEFDTDQTDSNHRAYIDEGVWDAIQMLFDICPEYTTKIMHGQGAEVAAAFRAAKSNQTQPTSN